MSSDDFGNFINLHKQLNDLNTSHNASWDGHLYLPPCTCYAPNSSPKCHQASLVESEPFDFSKFDSVPMKTLTDVITECKTTKNNNTQLCKKYSLNSLKETNNWNIKAKEKVKIVLQSEVFKKKFEVLKADLKLLFPLCGSNFTFKSRKSDTAIKYNIMCSNKRIFREAKSKSSTPSNKMRRTSTSRAITPEKCCPFFVNLCLDLKTLNWYVHHMSSLQHQHHHPTKFEGFSIGKHQLTKSMIQEIHNLQSCFVTSSIQQRILLQNTNISVPRRTLLNKQYDDMDNILANSTDAERLLNFLHTQENITYFAMYANSSDSNLLSIPKKCSAAINDRNNIAMTGYVRIHPDKEAHPIAPHIDSALQTTLKDIVVHHKDKGNAVKILLTVGWARNEDIAVLRRFPEVLQMDTTFKTNREVRPLFNIVCKDSNNKLCTVFRCLLPSEKRAVFHSILTTVMPKILGSDTCEKVKFIITDGDSQEIEACRSAVQTVFSNARHMSCLWHLIHQSLAKTPVIHNPRLKDILKHWLYFTATNSESTFELNTLLSHLKV